MSQGSERGAAPPARFAPAGFFVFRTPLLPFEALAAWAEGLSAPAASEAQLEQALAHDKQLLRSRLRRWIADPVVREALFVASPSLYDSLRLWEMGPDPERAQKVESALVRYFARMAGRATPFGLFAGTSLGSVGQKTHLRVVERTQLRLHTRLGLDYVTRLVEQLHAQPEVRGALRYVPNTSLYPAGDRLRYLEPRGQGHERSYQLVSVEPTPYLLATLERARAGATREALAQALAAEDPEVALEDARGYVDTLITERVLVPSWAPPISGPEPVSFLIETAEDIPVLSGPRQVLGSVNAELQRMDAAGPGRSPEDYHSVTRSLGALPLAAELPRLFRVDTFRAAPEASLSSRVTRELLRGVEALRLTTASRRAGPLERFKERFQERYEQRAVPLMEALDEERGIGFTFARGHGRTTGPLLEGFDFPPERAGELPFEPLHAHLLRRLEAVWRSGARELLLSEEDVAACQAPSPAELPAAFGIFGTVVAASAEAVDRGDFRVLLKNLHGPNGAVSLGRFCHGDAEMEARVREHLRAEEALEPEALFAELVHHPPGHEANVAGRPRLRQHELVLLAESGAAREDRIPLEDLWVSVDNGRIVLRSRSRDRQVRPRLGNLHNYSTSSVGVYRFLAELQNERAPTLAFSWGPLRNAASFLPRVVYGRTVLAVAQWNLEAPLLAAWSGATGASRFASVQRFRAEAGLPRWVSIREQDKQIPVDLDNVLAVEVLLALLKGRTSATLEELYPGPEQLLVEGGDGRYVHELVVPFVREAPPPSPRPRRPLAPESTDTKGRGFPPGSEWLYLKLYDGPHSLDRLLAGSLGEAIHHVLSLGQVKRWFFIRYRDPEPHLRLRFHAEPAHLESTVWPLLKATCASAMKAGTAWRLQLDTYEREVERYGGPAGIELVEDIFRADSEAVLEILRSYPGPEGARLRWRLTLRGMDALLDDLRLGLEVKQAITQGARTSLGDEFHADEGTFQEQLQHRYRRERRELEALLSQSPGEQGPTQAGLQAFARRGALLRPTVERLRQEEREGRLTVPIAHLAGSLLHMHVNRMLPDEQRAQELILHDFLNRTYRSRRARQGS